MSHQRYASQDVLKEPHPISLKVLRLSRPSLVSQYAVAAPLSKTQPAPTVPASLAYREAAAGGGATSTNTDPFLLSPILNLPPSFGSAYVGESFACTLCANHDAAAAAAAAVDGGGGSSSSASPPRKAVRDVRIEAEMKTPSTAGAVKLTLTPESPGDGGGSGGVDLEVGQTLQKVVRFDLKEEGNHVLAVTVSYYEATETSGRTRTFRKLYQFICKSSLIVRTKAGPYAPVAAKGKRRQRRRWVLEAQLENCGEDVIQLDRVLLELEPALACEDCNEWSDTASLPAGASSAIADAANAATPAALATRGTSRKPVLHPGEVEQVSFLIEETGPGLPEESNGRLVFGYLGIGWRGEMGNRGFLSTGMLGTRTVR